MTRLRLRSIWEWSLGTKLALTFLVVVAGVAALVSVSVISRGRAELDSELRKRGVNLTLNLARLSVEPVLQDDLWALYKIVRDTAGGSRDTEDVVAYAMVLDPEGRILAHSDPARYPMGESVLHDPVARPGGRIDGVSLHSAAAGRNETIHDVAVPIVLDKQRIGVARVGVTTRHLEATVTRMARDVLLITTLLAASGVALGFFISRRMTRALRKLGQAVDRLAEGRLDEVAPVTTLEKDEIGRLADRFNEMAQRLRDNVLEIEVTKRYLENLLENANDFIYTLDLDGRITYVNRRFLELGLRREDLLGRSWESVLARPAIAGTDRTLSTQEFEVEVRAGGDRRRTLVVGESPLLDEGHRPIGILGIAKDVTERKELEARLIKSERLASAGELAGALAHEIRNPLGSLVAAARMLTTASPQAASYDRAALVRVIAEEARRLSGILSDFLQFARPRPPRRLPHSVNGLVTEVVESFRLDGLAGQTVELRLDPGIPLVPVDADQIKQVLWNVIRNAIEASPVDGRLGIATGTADGRVLVDVTDSGAGIPAEQQARLFEPLHTTKPGGSGLGLAIAHRIVTAHAGTIEVRSAPGAGTRVRIALPREVPA